LAAYNVQRDIAEWHNADISALEEVATSSPRIRLISLPDKKQDKYTWWRMPPKRNKYSPEIALLLEGIHVTLVTT